MARSSLTPAMVTALAAACGGPGPGPGNTPPPTTCPIPTAVAAPTFRTDILPFLRQSCGASSATSCHGGNTPPGHVSYDPSRTAAEVSASLVGATPANAPPGWQLVAPSDLAHSWIVEKVTRDQPGGAGYGARMPYGAPNLCAATVQTLESWISAGAPF